MSKIYKALEKAERERKKDEPSISAADDLFLAEPEGAEAAPHVLGPGKVFPPASSPQKQFQKMAGPGQTDGGAYDPRLIMLSEPGSVAAEQFRKLRTHIHRHNSPAAPLRTIMVTSSISGEGKSFIAANLAVTISLDLQASALLVDCDLRNPTLTQWFGLQDGYGLSDYLKGNNGFWEFAKETGVGKLNILTAGSIQDNPTELIGSNRMKALVRELSSRNSNEFVIFDSTPLLATSEPEVLAKLVDGVIFVVRAGATPRETVQQALACLEKKKILGIVLNDLTFKAAGLHSRYFGSSYGYYYKYGYGAKSYGYGAKPHKDESRVRKAFKSIRGK